MTGTEEKYEKLKQFIREKGKNGVVVAFSGGIDSSTLAAVAHAVLGDRSVAVTAKSPTYPAEELKDAKRVAEEIGISLQIIETNELTNEAFARNPVNRCYYCKKELMGKLLDVAFKMGFQAVFEGTNSSDLTEHRPGFQAVQELANVYSPWVESGFTKTEIRGLAKSLGLSVHGKPALACLASRIPFHERITAEKLRRVEQAEHAVREITGLVQLRVRDHNGLARIEVPKEERSRLLDAAVLDEVACRLRALGFRYVTVDVEGYRSGSMMLTAEPEDKE